MNLKQFTKLIQPELDRAGVKFKMPKRYDSLGSFCSDSKELIVCLGGEFVFQTLIHEYCHFKQWRENEHFWNKKSTSANELFQWLDGAEYKSVEVLKFHEETIELELDCETRALKLVQELDLDVNPQLYTAAANCYLFSYLFVLEKKRWVTGIYRPLILRYMPAKLLSVKEYLDKDNLSIRVQNEYELL